MARIRTVKPELWSDPEFTECSVNARLLFIAALNFASDFGVLADKPKQLKMQCFPGDNVRIDRLIDELVEHRFWVRRTAPDGANVLVIRTFVEHQKVNRPNDGRWGDPSTWTDFTEDSLSDHGTITAQSPPEGNGREGSNTSSIAKPIDDANHDFDAFWTAYPRKVSRPDAVKAWRKLKPPERIAALAALPHHVSAWERTKTEPQFIPHASRWINARRWEDQVQAVRADTAQVDRTNGAVMSEYARRNA